MKSHTYTVTLHVRSDAPIAVLRERNSWQGNPMDDDYKCYFHTILSVEVKKFELWDAEAQLELGGST